MPKRHRLPEGFRFEGYTEEQLAQILRGFSLRRDSDRASFVKELNEIAWHGCVWETITAAEGTPSERERRFRARAQQVAKLAIWLEELYGQEAVLHSEDGDEDRTDGLTPRDFDRRYLEHAARELTDQDGPPGREEGSPHRWNRLDQAAVERLWNLHELLPWFKRCCESVADRLAAEKAVAGGNRAAEGLEYLVRQLTAFFAKHSAEPATAYSDRSSGEARGRLVDFLESCLEPLGYKRSRNSILDAIEKIRHKHPHPSRPDRRT